MNNIMMNKTTIAMVILAGSAFASVAQAADGTINFTGNITDAACTVSAGTKTQTVNLGTISASSFDAAGAVSGASRFNVTLESCPASAATASVVFDGQADTANSTLLALTPGTGVATGVGVGIYEEDSVTQLPVSTRSASKALSTTAPTTFTYVAKYMATAATVQAGTANAVSDFTISYN
ncbi:fimbrial protein [Serratia marcescens]|uniref:fimbrial protein n=2 Tax=Serratia marcescens TaxID=615 RepID=UPI001FAEDC14|nr:fimbrial protein [Serratia marcescens]